MHAHRNPNGKLLKNVHNSQAERKNADKVTARMADVEPIRMLTAKDNNHENLCAIRGKLIYLIYIISLKFWIEYKLYNYL